jgi:RNA polymerase sigma-70 factor, ECF subfamily
MDAVVVSLDASPAGDRERFSELYRQYAPYVEAYARRRVNAQSVDDVVADVFAAGWRRFTEFDHGGLAWLYATARNVIGTHYRSLDRWAALRNRLTSLSPDDSVMDDWDPDYRDVYVGLARLDEGERELLLLYGWEGLEPRQIGAVLGISSGAASMRIHRAKARLQAVLDQLNQQGGRR